MEIAAFKVKSCNLPISTLVHPNSISRATEVRLMQTQFSWIQDSNTYKRSKFNLQQCDIKEI